MGIHTTSTVSARIGKLKGEILMHAMPVEVLGITGMQKQMPKNQSDTVVFRRWLPYGGVDNKWINGSNVDTFAPDHITQEGVTPSADSLSATDITVTLNQYSVLYSVTDRTADLYEDDVPSEMKKQTGERMGLVREMVRYGTLKGCTNKFYSGGNSVATTDETLSLNFIRKIARSLQSNHAKRVTSILSPSGDFGTAPVEAGYLVFVHTDMTPAIRDLPGYKHPSEYGTRKVVHENEIGSVEEFRFIGSPELAPILGASGVTPAVGTTGLLDSASSGYVDVYPCIVAGEDAWGQVALRGMDSVDVTYLPPGQKDKNDPLGQRGYIGAKTYMAASVLNNGWMAVAYAGTPSL